MSPGAPASNEARLAAFAERYAERLEQRGDAERAALVRALVRPKLAFLKR